MKKANTVTLATRQTAEAVSELTTNRLSVYLRHLNALDAAGVRTISSRALAEQFHLNAAQIRKDLACFGEFGVRGVGYYVKVLREHLRHILGLDRGVKVAIMGAGNLGFALADYPGFAEDGFEVAALFDTVRDKIGRRSRGGIPVYDVRDLKRIVQREQIGIAVIAVPGAVAQHVVQLVVAAGVRAILNFSPGALKVPASVKLKSVDVTVSLENLSFFLASACGPNEATECSRPKGGRRASASGGGRLRQGYGERGRSSAEARAPRALRKEDTGE